jgi:tetratricopeptide (TPR) repeat protein
VPAPAAAGNPAAPNPEAILAQARARQAAGDYDQAADGYEAFARLRPQAKEAPQALQDAVALRLGLGQPEAAAQDADRYLKSYGTTTSAAVVTFSVAENAADREDWAAASKQLGAWVNHFDASGPLDVRIRAHAALGRTFAKLDQPKQAETEFVVVQSLWQAPAAAVRTIEAEGGDARRVGAATSGVGEALFFFAEQKRLAAEIIHYPEYHGTSSKEAILKHIRTKVADWVKARARAVEEAEREYRRVLQIQPAPPARWVVASASRVGMLWARFNAEFRAAPISREWKGDGAIPGTTMRREDVRRIYYGALDEASEPIHQQAVAAFKTCLVDSARFQYADEHSRRCEEWLTKNQRVSFPQIHELAPRSRLLGPAVPAFAPAPARR